MLCWINPKATLWLNHLKIQVKIKIWKAHLPQSKPWDDEYLTKNSEANLKTDVHDPTSHTIVTWSFLTNLRMNHTSFDPLESKMNKNLPIQLGNKIMNTCLSLYQLYPNVIYFKIYAKIPQNPPAIDTKLAINHEY